jgi:23S rRNA (pseudouridine1915-N3)-methyltransferase
VRFDIVAVGKLDADLKPVFDRYRRMIGPAATVSLREVRETPTQHGTPDEVRRDEGRRLLAALPKRGVVVALDESGRLLDSRGFAAKLQAWSERGGATLLVGGSLGLSPEVRDRADEVVSLSRLTFPHQLARVVLIEQLFRGFRIARGEPYHH